MSCGCTVQPTTHHLFFDSATGFIGLPAAQALVRAGHYVYGLTRSQQKAKQLAAEESGFYVHLLSDHSYIWQI